MNPLQMMQDFNKFVQEFQKQNPNGNPQEMVQNLINQGKMSQAQFEQLRQTANMMAGMFGIRPMQ